MSKWFILLIVILMLFALLLGLHMGKQKHSSLYVSSIKPSGKIHLQKIEVKLDINDILTHKPINEGNAANLYIQALTGMTSSIFLTGYISPTTQVNYAAIPELVLIEKAALIKECNFSPQYNSPVISYSTFTIPSFGPFNPPPGKYPEILRLLNSKGVQYEKERKMDKAISEYEAIILMRERIMKEAINLPELLWTLPSANSTITKLQAIYQSQGNLKMVEKCQKYKDEARDAFNLVEQKRKIFQTLKPTNATSSTAWFFPIYHSIHFPMNSIDDLIEISLFDQDPAWRRTTILLLGIHRFDIEKQVFGIKYNAPYKGKIESVLDYISIHDSDSTIRIASENALNLNDYIP